MSSSYKQPLKAVSPGDLQFFVRAARSASLSAAARELAVSPQAASAALKRLESALGFRLFVRSTRSLRPTPEGLAFLDACERGLALIDQARERLAAGREALAGRIRLSMPSDLGRNVVLPWLQAFREQHPGIEFELQLTDRVAELAREAVDVALRYGEPADTQLVAVALAPHNRRVLCASPAYLARHGRPAQSQDLVQHRCLSYRLSDRPHERWRFERDGRELAVEVHAALRCDDGDAVRRMAIFGEGIAYKSGLDVTDDLRRGALVALCEDWQGEPAPLFLACADRSVLRPAVQRLRDFLAERLATLG
ncbi:LysR family transcriptional regulator [Rubrivivax sp. JA1055]|uniref:LysR family transcriptional regulator n=1 Tax=Rubrivivax sp. JA1055 TaxID=2894194 RepID=UPI001E51E80F|nr:LysR family transcriptional regulator [Rubrivivax sp. JA1055]MCC9598852.1 LysR substrate-binding domain-containing protein [Rubrivivax sp. JA1055]